MKYLVLFLLLASEFAIAQGAIGGNGGGIIKIPGRPDVVLDYFEALQSVQEDETKLLPIETYTRSEFFELIQSRIKIGESIDKKQVVKEFHKPALNTIFDVLLEKIGPIEQWPSSKPWRTHDEAVAYSLPANATYLQAAITNHTGTYQISSATSSLSSGQKLILELHELLYYNLMGRAWREVILTSVPVRNYIKILIKKKVTTPELRIAYHQFKNPTDVFELKKGSVHRVSTVYESNLLYSKMGVWLRKGGNTNCANAVVIAPVTGTNNIIYQFFEQQDGTVATKTEYAENWSLDQNCEYMHSHSGLVLMKDIKEIFPLLYGTGAIREHAKNIIQYYEQKMNGVEPQLESAMQALRLELKW